MSQNMSKSTLAVLLSKLEGFSEPKMRQEQYVMDSEIGASLLWNACILGDIGKKSIVDLGCGTGILGIGALLLGASSVVFIDSDEKALDTAKNNISKVKSEGYNVGISKFICQEVEDVGAKEDVVLENPPFGTKVKHKDIAFLEKALEIAPIVYSFHKSETKAFLKQFAGKNGAEITHIWDYRFPLKRAFEFHRRKIHRINVSCIRFEKNAQ